MKAQKHRYGPVALGLVALQSLIVLLVLAACREGLPFSREPEGPANVTHVDDRGHTDVDLGLLAEALGELRVGELSEPELEAILYLREEEKLARDVLRLLGALWEEPAFDRVAEREDTHTAAIKALIDRYELWDPMSVTEEGQYVSEELYELHYRLVEEGSVSLVAALKVAAAIQEISILDLREYLAETDDADVQMVYENLRRASRNHLRVFVRLLEQQGEVARRTYLSQSLFEEIAGTPPETGMDQEEAGH
jgi:hypothetical protein